jgi:hypothetical protein
MPSLNFLHFSQLYILSPLRLASEKLTVRQSSSLIIGPDVKFLEEKKNNLLYNYKFFYIANDLIKLINQLLHDESTLFNNLFSNALKIV